MITVCAGLSSHTGYILNYSTIFPASTYRPGDTGWRTFHRFCIEAMLPINEDVDTANITLRNVAAV